MLNLNNMKRFFLFFCFIFLFSSCYRVESEGVMRYEEGYVLSKEYTPAHMEPHLYLDDKGNIRLRMDHVSENYELRIVCNEHGRTSEVSQAKAISLWKTLKEGDDVIISYYVLNRVYDDGSKEFHDFDFVTAKRQQYTGEQQ